MSYLASFLKLVAPVFAVVGALHLALGVGADVLLGARLPAEALTDPALDSQNRFYGVAFSLYGVLLYLCATDLRKYATVLRCVLANPSRQPTCYGVRPPRAGELKRQAAQRSAQGGISMQITLASISVEDQDRALAFYTSVLGFQKKNDIPMGQFRWLTVSSPEGAAGVELVLEPMAFPPSRTYQKALFEAGIPATAFMTKDIFAEYQKLKALGVKFRGEPASMGPVTVVLFEDNCGNLINLVQPAA